ncbi:hypothetical protein EJB05_38534, partial [Eragrostis curvula]
MKPCDQAMETEQVEYLPIKAKEVAIGHEARVGGVAVDSDATEASMGRNDGQDLTAKNGGPI